MSCFGHKVDSRTVEHRSQKKLRRQLVARVCMSISVPQHGVTIEMCVGSGTGRIVSVCASEDGSVICPGQPGCERSEQNSDTELLVLPWLTHEFRVAETKSCTPAH